LTVEVDRTWFTYLKVQRTIKKQIPTPAWQAIRLYLEKSGRLPHIQAQDYIFAPLAIPLGTGIQGVDKEWDSSRYLRASFFGNNLRRFARVAGIPTGRVTMASLRNTAIMLCKQSGAGNEQLMHFTTSDYTDSLFRQVNSLEGNMLAHIGLLPSQNTLDDPLLDGEPHLDHHQPLSPSSPPTYQRQIFKHGFRTRTKIFTKQLAPILAEGREDLDQEIAALQDLNDRLYNMAEGVSDWPTHLLLSETYSHSISRHTRMMHSNQVKQEFSQTHWLKDLYQVATRMVAAGEVEAGELENFPWGEEAASSSVDRAAYPLLQENIARLRFMMNKAYQNSHRLEKPADLMRMIDGYGLMGIKLANLLELKSTGGDNLEELRERAIAQALDPKTT
jgi:hypothetical protein